MCWGRRLLHLACGLSGICQLGAKSDQWSPKRSANCSLTPRAGEHLTNGILKGEKGASEISATLDSALLVVELILN